MFEGGRKFVGKLVTGTAFAGGPGIAALHDKTADDAVEGHAVEVGFAGVWPEGAFGEAHETGDGEWGSLEFQSDRQGAVGRLDFSVKPVGKIGASGEVEG